MLVTPRLTPYGLFKFGLPSWVFAWSAPGYSRAGGCMGISGGLEEAP
jgi:hypothetical protein